MINFNFQYLRTNISSSQNLLKKNSCIYNLLYKTILKKKNTYLRALSRPNDPFPSTIHYAPPFDFII